MNQLLFLETGPSTPVQRVSVDEQASFQYVKYKVEITDEYLDCWARSFDLRKEFLETNDIDDYYDIFPALKTQAGKSLLLQDFERQYPEYTKKLYGKWDVFVQKIIKLLSDKALISDELDGWSAGKYSSKFLY